MEKEDSKSRFLPKSLSHKRELDKNRKKELRKLGLINKTDEFKKWRAKNPLAYKAQTLANHFLRKNPAREHSCVICGEAKAHKHHPDYNKPLEVVWVCVSCHQKIHLGILKVENELIVNLAKN